MSCHRDGSPFDNRRTFERESTKVRHLHPPSRCIDGVKGGFYTGSQMKLIVVGGHSRNIGKTSVMAGLIRGLPSLGWTAVKITQYGHGICSQDGKPCGCEPKVHPFELTEETDP